MVQVSFEIINHLSSCNIFANLGKNFAFEVEGFPHVQQLTEMSQVNRSLQSTNWENFTLEARNGLTLYLSQKQPDKYQTWNKVTETYKAQFTQFESFFHLLPKDIDQAVVHDFNWNVLAMCMESHFNKFDKSLPILFKKLLPIYQAGHIPCGWLGPIESAKKTLL